MPDRMLRLVLPLRSRTGSVGGSRMSSGVAECDHDRSTQTVLSPWEELTGTLEDLTIRDGQVVVKVSGRVLSVAVESRAGEILQSELVDREGTAIGILRIPDRNQPVAVRQSVTTHDA